MLYYAILTCLFNTFFCSCFLISYFSFLSSIFPSIIYSLLLIFFSPWSYLRRSCWHKFQAHLLSVASGNEQRTSLFSFSEGSICSQYLHNHFSVKNFHFVFENYGQHFGVINLHAFFQTVMQNVSKTFDLSATLLTLFKCLK